MPSRTAPHPQPIDFLAEASSYINNPPVIVNQPERHLSVYDELGGITSPKPVWGSPTGLYVPAADVFRADGRKTELARGLGELGLIIMTPDHLEAMSKTAQLRYAAALTDYVDTIYHRGSRLAVEGSHKEDLFVNRYGETSESWAKEYAAQLRGLHRTVSESPLYLIANARDVVVNDIQKIRHRQSKGLTRGVHILRHPVSGKLSVHDINAPVRRKSA